MEGTIFRHDVSNTHAMETLNVCVTGAAGQIAYSLLPYLLNGTVFGYDYHICLRLLDIEPMASVLQGVKMELEDCAYSLLTSVVISADPLVAFKDVDVAVLVGAMPRKEGMSRRDLLRANVKIFKAQGQALDQVAKKSAKVLVVGNPANTNCFIAMTYAPSIPKKNFTALTRLDYNRAVDMIAKRLNVKCDQVRNVIIWGNHSSTQFPDVNHAFIHGYPKFGNTTKVTDAIKDEKWISSEFIKSVQERGAAVIAARKLSSAMSAAKAIADHLHTWIFGTLNGGVASMAVVSPGTAYGVPENLIFSFPVSIRDGEFQIKEDLNMNDFAREMIMKTVKELVEERDEALNTVEE